MKTTKNPICENCKKELLYREIEMCWHFKNGEIWFCGNSCATAWCVEQHLKKNKTKKEETFEEADKRITKKFNKGIKKIGKIF